MATYRYHRLEDEWYFGFFEWIHISYFEINQRIGSMFRSDSKTVYVDGFTNALNNPDRFSLGRLNLNRTQLIQNAFGRIRDGVKVTKVNGRVKVNVLFDGQICVHSRYFHKTNFLQLDFVNRVQPRDEMEIFDYNGFNSMFIKKKVDGVEAVSGLAEYCTIRLSFGEGWGADQERRFIDATPC